MSLNICLSFTLNYITTFKGFICSFVFSDDLVQFCLTENLVSIKCVTLLMSLGDLYFQQQKEKWQKKGLEKCFIYMPMTLLM